MTQKQFTLLTFIIALIVLNISNALGQKIMMLDSILKINSTPLEAKRNFIGSLGKYQFGPYKIVSGKAGLTYGKSKTYLIKDPGLGLNFNSDKGFSFFIKLFNEEVVSESNSKLSFLFVANENDSVTVNTSTKTNSSRIEEHKTSNLIFYNQVYTALISAKSDTTVWKMIIVTFKDKDNTIQKEGFLTDGYTNITIRKVEKWDNGKNSYLNIGYEFLMDNNSIAAVQASPDTFKKRFVWLHQNLVPQMKLVLAAASASILVRIGDFN